MSESRLRLARDGVLRVSRKRPGTREVRNDLLELHVIHHARLLHAMDAAKWTGLFNSTTQTLLSARPLQSLTKRGRLAVVMCIVGSGRTDLFAPTVLAVLACDWANDWASFKFLEDTTRQASLSGPCSECDAIGAVPSHWSRHAIATKLEEGVASTIAKSWRGLGIGGEARQRVEKAGRELRGLAVRCRGASDRLKARELMSCYLDSNRMESFVQAFVAWGRTQLRASGGTIFDKAFHFLEERQVQASALRVAQIREAGRRYSNTHSRIDPDGQREDTLERLDVVEDTEFIGSSSYGSPEGMPVLAAATDSEEDHLEARLHAWGRQGWSVASRSSGTPSNVTVKTAYSSCFPRSPSVAFRSLQPKRRQMWSPSEAKGDKDRPIHGQARERPVNERRKQRQLGVMRADKKIFVKRCGNTNSGEATTLWRRGAVEAIREDGTYNVRYDDGEVDHLVRHFDVFEDHAGDLPEGLLKLLEKDSSGDGRDNQDRDIHPRRKKLRSFSLVDESEARRSPESRPASSDKRLATTVAARSTTKTALRVKEQRRMSHTELPGMDNRGEGQGTSLGAFGRHGNGESVPEWAARRNSKRKVLKEHESEQDTCQTPVVSPTLMESSSGYQDRLLNGTDREQVGEGACGAVGDSDGGEVGKHPSWEKRIGASSQLENQGISKDITDRGLVHIEGGIFRGISRGSTDGGENEEGGRGADSDEGEDMETDEELAMGVGNKSALGEEEEEEEEEERGGLSQREEGEEDEVETDVEFSDMSTERGRLAGPKGAKHEDRETEEDAEEEEEEEEEDGDSGEDDNEREERESEDEQEKEEEEEEEEEEGMHGQGQAKTAVSGSRHDGGAQSAPVENSLCLKVREHGVASSVGAVPSSPLRSPWIYVPRMLLSSSAGIDDARNEEHGDNDEENEENDEEENEDKEEARGQQQGREQAEATAFPLRHDGSVQPIPVKCSPLVELREHTEGSPVGMASSSPLPSLQLFVPRIQASSSTSNNEARNEEQEEKDEEKEEKEEEEGEQGAQGLEQGQGQRKTPVAAHRNCSNVQSTPVECSSRVEIQGHRRASSVGAIPSPTSPLQRPSVTWMQPSSSAPNNGARNEEQMGGGGEGGEDEEEEEEEARRQEQMQGQPKTAVSTSRYDGGVQPTPVEPSPRLEIREHIEASSAGAVLLLPSPSPSPRLSVSRGQPSARNDDARNAEQEGKNLEKGEQAQRQEQPKTAGSPSRYDGTARSTPVENPPRLEIQEHRGAYFVGAVPSSPSLPPQLSVPRMRPSASAPDDGARNEENSTGDEEDGTEEEELETEGGGHGNNQTPCDHWPEEDDCERQRDRKSEYYNGVRGDGQGSGESIIRTPEPWTPVTNRRIATKDWGSGVSEIASGAGENGPNKDSQSDGEKQSEAGIVDPQPPRPPPKFVRVYGSAGISRVKQSMQDWLFPRQPTL